MTHYRLLFTPQTTRLRPPVAIQNLYIRAVSIFAAQVFFHVTILRVVRLELHSSNKSHARDSMLTVVVVVRNQADSTIDPAYPYHPVCGVHG